MQDQLRKIFDETCVGLSDFVSAPNVKVENGSVKSNRSNRQGYYKSTYQGHGGY